ncbi:MAG: hypothetical protein A3F13_04820 [Gammaproteobacteria bacterium RIFCSPHIGHO2_12_FULL_40_19]|nr:MAG: hypothetical protein A3F13_04820 [Gammaproteobacteria bacterium RIFCSPHIGHO2_12_FULL_40_19]
MEEKIKQRLIGVLVIVGALFIILPFLFHNSRPTVSQKTSTNIPNSPGSSSVALTLPAATPATAAATTPATESTATAESTSETTVAATGTTPAQVAQSESAAAPTASSAPSAALNNTGNSNNTAMPANTAAANTTATPNVAPANNTVTAANSMPAANNATAASKTITADNTSAVDSTAVTAANMPSTKMASASTTAAAKVAPLVKSGEFSGSPATSAALTTGQANEGPAQAMQTMPASAAQSFDSTTPAVTKPVTATHTHHAATQHHAAAKAAMHASNKDAWSIQLGVFSNKKNASHLISKLRAAHYEVYSHSVKHGQQILMAVFVGPEVNLHKTELMKQHLKQQFQLNGVVKKYQA